MSSFIERLEGQIGATFYSDWVLVDQEMIQCFADVTRDQQYIHVDLVRASASPFGGTVAHGFLTLSLLTHLRELTPELNPSGIKMGVNYGFEKIRFISPVRAGGRIRAKWNTISIEAKGNSTYHIHDNVEIEIAGRASPQWRRFGSRASSCNPGKLGSVLYTCRLSTSERKPTCSSQDAN